MPKIFSSFLSGFNVISKKKKVLCLSSASFLCDLCDVPERGAVNCSCLRFLAGNKNAGFWREKKCRNSQNISAKMPEKISHFFALIGNTGVYTEHKVIDSLRKVLSDCKVCERWLNLHKIVFECLTYFEQVT